MNSALHPHWLRLRPRFTLLVLLGVGLVSAALAWLTHQENSRALLAARQGELQAMASYHAEELSAYLQTVGDAAKDLAAALQARQPAQEQELTEDLRQYLDASPTIFGLGVAYAANAFDPKRKLYCLYLNRNGQGYRVQQLGTEQYNYPVWDWYLIPSLLGRSLWTEPYFGTGGGVVMTTCSVPVMAQGQVRAVVAADLALEALGHRVRQLQVGSGGFAFLLTRQGAFLAAPVEDWVMRESIFSLAEQWGRPELRALGRTMVAGGQGLVRTADWRNGDPAWLAFAPVKGPDWCFGVMVAEREVLGPVWAMTRHQVLIAVPGLLALAVVVWLMVVGLTRPLRRLVGAASRLAEGDLSVQVTDVRPGDEVGELAQAFNGMVADLNRYLNELTATTKAKERIESELDLARQIQESILPRSYPAFPDQPHFDLFARTLPAREVGGDFYDFFFIDPDHLGLVVGDVSGKGVPAALFMTVSRTLIKNASVHHHDPLRALHEVNAQILPDNEMCMFVTVFYGVYELSTGTLRYVSAGHPLPLLRRAGGPMEALPQVEGMAVGVHDELGLTLGQVALGPDDLILVFTDGLDEAVDSAGQCYGLPRARAWLTEAVLAPAPQMLEGLIAHWREFTGEVDQFDDLTLLLFRRKP